MPKRTTSPKDGRKDRLERFYGEHAVSYRLPNYRRFLRAEDSEELAGELYAFTVCVESRGRESWAVTDQRGQNFGKSGRVGFEPMPSSRTAEFLAEYRMSKTEAFELAARSLRIVLRDKLDFIKERIETLKKKREGSVREQLAFFERLLQVVETGIASVEVEFFEAGKTQ